MCAQIDDMKIVMGIQNWQYAYIFFSEKAYTHMIQVEKFFSSISWSF